MVLNGFYTAFKWYCIYTACIGSDSGFYPDGYLFGEYFARPPYWVLFFDKANMGYSLGYLILEGFDPQGWRLQSVVKRSMSIV